MSFWLLYTAILALPLPDEASSTAAEVERRYLILTRVMGRLLESQEKGKEQASGRLEVALARSSELKIVPRLKEVRRMLDSRMLRHALEEEKHLEKDLDRILRILKGEDESEQIKEDNQDLEELRDQIERLEKIIEEQKENLDKTSELLEQSQDKQEGEENSGDDKENAKKKDELSAKLQEAKRRMDQVRQAMERKLNRNSRDAAKNQNQSGNPKNGKQENQQANPQENQQENQQDGQQENQESGSQESQQAKQQKKRNQKAGQQSLQQASRRTQDAAQRLESSNLEGSRKDQEEALERLNEARDEMAEKLEEEEAKKQEKALQMVIGKLFAMQAEQQLINDETRTLEALHETLKEKPPAAAEEVASGAKLLATRERGLHSDTVDVLHILEEDGSSVIAPEVIKRLQDDLESTAARLDRADTGKLTQILQEDMASSVQELIDVLQAHAKRLGQRGQQGGNPGGGSPSGGGGGGGGKGPPLFDPLKELKLLLSMQRRIRERTERFESLGVAVAEGSPAGAEAAPAIDGRDAELRSVQGKRLAGSQKSLAELLKALVQKYPVIDKFLLGGVSEDGDDEEGAGADQKDRDAPKDGGETRKEKSGPQ